MCKTDFLKDPAKHIATLDEAVIAAQKPEYPLDTCVVSEQDLESMGGSVDMVVGDRLVRLCCNFCKKDFRTSPTQYLSKLDVISEPAEVHGLDAQDADGRKEEPADGHGHDHGHGGRSH